MRAGIGLGFLTLVAQFFYITNSHSYWDGLIYAQFVETGEKIKFITPWIQNGRGVLGSMYWTLSTTIGLSGGIQALVAVCLWISCLLAIRILTRASWLPRSVTLFSGAVLLVFPALHVHASFTATFYILLLPSLLASILLRQKAEEEPSRMVLYLCLSFVLLFCSFFSEALIVSSFAIPFFVRFLPRRTFLESGRGKWIFIDLLYFVLPLFYLILLPRLMPVSGSYTDSRSLSSSPSELFEFASAYVTTFVTTPVFKISLWKFLVAISVFGLFTNRKNLRKYLREIFSEKILFFVLCAGWFALAASPFILSTRVPSNEGWNARHFTALVFPISLLISSWLFMWLDSKKSLRLAGALLVFGLMTSLVRFQLVWEARAAFDRGVQFELVQSSIDKAGVVVMPSKVSSVLSEHYRFYEWNSLIYETTGNWQRIIIQSPNALADLSHDPEVIFQQESFLINPIWREKMSCVVQLDIKPTRPLTWQDGLHFWWLQRTGSRNLENWTRGLSQLSISPNGC